MAPSEPTEPPTVDGAQALREALKIAEIERHDAANAASDMATAATNARRELDHLREQIRHWERDFCDGRPVEDGLVSLSSALIAARQGRDQATGHLRYRAGEILDAEWRSLRDGFGADNRDLACVQAVIAAFLGLGAIDAKEAAVWSAAILSCPGHDDEGGRSWCAFCGNPKPTTEVIHGD